MFVCAGCGEEETASKKKKVIVVRKPTTSQVDNSSTEEENISDDYYTDYNDYDTSVEEVVERQKRELALKQTTTEEKYVPEYTVSKSNWNGPNGYVIVYPKGNIQLKLMAINLRNYFSETAGVTLNVVDDSVAAVSKEILIGDTNRLKSTLKITEYAVSLKNDKLFFESGNFNGVIKALRWFISFDYEKGKVNLLNGTYEFKSVLKLDGGDYKYVWGDDFDGNKLDSSFWDLTLQMDNYGYSELMVVNDEEHISVSEGKLKLLAGKYLDARNANIKYNATYTVASKYKVNYQYGYLELRARYPIKQGAWPSWWMSGNCGEGTPAAAAFPNVDSPKNIGNIYQTTFSAELDILEYIECIPNMHRWFFDGTHDHLGAIKKLTGYSLGVNDSYIYHTFACEWTPNEVKLYGDGILYNTLSLTESYNDIEDMIDFRNPMFMFFNNHVLPDQVPNDDSSTPFEYYIDYVRLYQKDGEGGIWFTDAE